MQTRYTPAVIHHLGEGGGEIRGQFRLGLDDVLEEVPDGSDAVLGDRDPVRVQEATEHALQFPAPAIDPEALGSHLQVRII